MYYIKNHHDTIAEAATMQEALNTGMTLVELLPADALVYISSVEDTEEEEDISLPYWAQLSVWKGIYDYVAEGHLYPTSADFCPVDYTLKNIDGRPAIVTADEREAPFMYPPTWREFVYAFRLLEG